MFRCRSCQKVLVPGEKQFSQVTARRARVYLDDKKALEGRVRVLGTGTETVSEQPVCRACLEQATGLPIPIEPLSEAAQRLIEESQNDSWEYDRRDDRRRRRDRY